MLKTLLFCFIIITTTGCNRYKYSNYHADWIVTKFEVNQVSQEDKIGMSNFIINLKTGMATAMGFYHEGKEYMDMEERKFKISTLNNVNYIEFLDHPLLNEVYQIKCNDEDCCELEISNTTTVLSLRYNGEIPFGKNRPNCY